MFESSIQFIAFAALLLSALLLAWNRALAKRSERVTRSLKQSKRQLREMFDQAPAGIAHAAPDGRLIRVNDRFAAILGYPEATLERLGLVEITAEPFQLTTRRVIHDLLAGTITIYRSENRYRRADGSEFWCRATTSRILREDTGETDYLLLVIEDIDAQKRGEEREARLQAQLNQAQRLDALGRLTAGIVHDFNNTLGVVQGYLQLAQLSAEQERARITEGHLNRALQAGERSQQLVRQLLLFARGETGECRRFEVRHALESNLGLLKGSLPPTLQLQLRAPDYPCWVCMDPDQLPRLLLNLITNARDAMAPSGVIEVILERLESPVGGEAAEPGLPIGTLAPLSDNRHADTGLQTAPVTRWILLSVADTGAGMTERTQEQMFDPFFTTKGEKGGSGMGLAIVHGIMKGLNGRVAAESAPGKGTTVTLMFPEA